MASIRIKRLSEALKIQRRRLDFYKSPQTWPGKEIAWRSELICYDHYLIVAAEMLEVPAPDLPENEPLASDLRAALEDRLAVAGLDVFAPRNRTGNIMEDGDLAI